MRKQSTALLFMLCAMLAGGQASAEDMSLGRRYQSPLAVLADLILLRPFGIAMTAAGIGLMAGTAPFIAIASIAPPHDAFERAGNALVVGPAAFTFMRPLGEYTYQPTGAYPIRP
ncbi:hypothetical protein [Methylomagnum sp.]